MNAIDLEISGDDEGLAALAEWLEISLGRATTTLRDELRALRNDSTEHWSGQTGEAFRDTLNAFRDGAEPSEIYALDAAEVLRAYAARLRRGKESFRGLSEEASSGGLAVSGKWITMPVPVSSAVGGSGATDWDRGAVDRMRNLLDDIGTKVGDWWSDLGLWVDEHFGKLLSRAGELDTLVDRYKVLEQGNSLTRGATFNVYSENLKRRLSEFEQAAINARERAASHTSRRNSGAPAVKAAALAEGKPELLAARDALDSEVKKLRLSSRALPAIGFTVDVAAAGIDVVNGGSISSSAVNIGLGLGGVTLTSSGGAIAAGALGLSGIGVPIALGVAATAAAQAIGEAGVYVYETTTTLDWREALDSADWEYFFDHLHDKPTGSRN